jgi:hypothetical protein
LVVAFGTLQALLRIRDDPVDGGLGNLAAIHSMLEVTAIGSFRRAVRAEALLLEYEPRWQ